MATILPFVKDGVFDHEDITGMSMALGRCVQDAEPKGR
jgi:hypothetical protein